jgi:hypothetical protein
LNALVAQLKIYGQRGIDTVRSVIAKWAPPGENNTQAYIANVAKSLGLSADAHLNMQDPKVLEALSNAIIRVENGKNPYSQQMLAVAAGDTSSTTNAPTLHQTTQITVNGSTNPTQTAKEVKLAQDSAYAQAMRRMQANYS